MNLLKKIIRTTLRLPFYCLFGVMVVLVLPLAPLVWLYDWANRDSDKEEQTIMVKTTDTEGNTYQIATKGNSMAVFYRQKGTEKFRLYQPSLKESTK